MQLRAELNRARGGTPPRNAVGGSRPSLAHRHTGDARHCMQRGKRSPESVPSLNSLRSRTRSARRDVVVSSWCSLATSAREARATRAVGGGGGGGGAVVAIGRVRGCR